MKRYAIALTLIIAVALAGCGKKEPQPGDGTGVGPQRPQRAQGGAPRGGGGARQQPAGRQQQAPVNCVVTWNAGGPVEDPEAYGALLDRSIERITAVADESKVKMTFFISGAVAELRPELFKKLAADGHVIGVLVDPRNHPDQFKADAEDAGLLTSYEADAQTAMINADVAKIKEALGIEPVAFRAAGLASNPSAAKAAREAGLRIVCSARGDKTEMRRGAEGEAPSARIPVVASLGSPKEDKIAERFRTWSQATRQDRVRVFCLAGDLTAYGVEDEEKAEALLKQAKIVIGALAQRPTVSVTTVDKLELRPAAAGPRAGARGGAGANAGFGPRRRGGAGAGRPRGPRPDGVRPAEVQPAETDDPAPPVVDETEVDTPEEVWETFEDAVEGGEDVPIDDTADIADEQP